MNSSARIANIHQTQSAFQVLGPLQLLVATYFWPKQASVKDGDTFDYIIVGAGSAGCVMANRLTEIPDISVLLIEAGGDPPIESKIPILFPYLKDSIYDWKYTSVNDNYTNQFHKDHNQKIVRGKMLGGCSSLNFMGYMRGNFHDYDTWAKITDDDTWSWDNVLPYFKKSECLDDSITLDPQYAVYHANDGLLGVTKNPHQISVEYLDAFAELGHGISDDVSGANPLGYMTTFYTISNNTRQSTAKSFLATAKDRCNLHVLKHATVTKILIDDDLNACGVEVTIENNRRIALKAEIEVIVSAGAIATPQLLMLSGIGPADHLKNKGIEVKVDLPVGECLQDHTAVMTVQKLDKSNPNTEPQSPYELPGNLIEGYAALDKDQKYPDYQSLNFIFNDHAAILDLSAFYFEFKNELCDELLKEIQGRQVFFSFVNLLYPKSCGKVLLNTTDINDHPVIYTGHYSDECDLDNHAEYLKDFLKIFKSNLFKNADSKLIVPEVCHCSKFVYDSKEFWKCYVLCLSSSIYHYSGTCPMGGVVDSRLQVFDVKNLRVVDASVMPKIPGANTNAPTIMIAEKAADFVKDDYYCRCSGCPWSKTSWPTKEALAGCCEAGYESQWT